MVSCHIGTLLVNFSNTFQSEWDLYCERLTSAWFDEPLGLFSNIAFIVAAIALAREPNNRREHWVLIALLTAIGLGSALFHAFATRLTLLLDVIPIQLFIIAATWILLRVNLGQPLSRSLIAIAGLIWVSTQIPSHLLNGSMGYLPAWLMLVLIGFAHPPGPARGHLITAAAIFPISLAFRTADLPLCQVWPYGTHFLWHLLNAYVLYRVIRATQSGRAANDVMLGDPAPGAYTTAKPEEGSDETSRV